MRFIPTAVHGFVDYLWGALLIGIALVQRWPDAEGWTAYLFGGGAIAYSLLTRYELGLVRLIPMRTHLLLDGAAGLILVASPWILGVRSVAAAILVGFGVFSLVASLVTRKDVRSDAMDTGRPSP